MFPAAAEKSSFKVELVSVEGGTTAKFKIIKEIRALKPDLGLAEVSWMFRPTRMHPHLLCTPQCKKLVDKLPAVLAEDMEKADAEALQARIKEAGATIELK